MKPAGKEHYQGLLREASAEEQASDWLAQMVKHQGAGVHYLSAPSNAVSYSATALTGARP